MSIDAANLSVVAPCFNEQEVLPAFLRRTKAVCEALKLPYEIILVDDGSRDNSWPIIAAAAAADPRVVGIRLRRNHGHQLALSAGIAGSAGALVLLIDADLQDPPELLPAMIERMQDEAADVVYGQRRQRAGETLFKRTSAAAFYRIIAWLSDIEIPRDTGDFRLITRQVADLLCRMPEHHRFIRGMIAWTGGRQVPFLYDRKERQAGTTKYPLRRMLRFAADAITGFSRRPLQVATGLGVLAGLSSILLAVYSLVGWIRGDNVPGWTSLISAIGFLSALQFFVLGVLGEYIGRLYEESRGRPLFLEAGRIGLGLLHRQPDRAEQSYEKGDLRG